MSPPHYFDESPRSPSEERTIDVVLPDVAFSMRTDRGVFSHGRLDKGTSILLREAPPPPSTGTLVDVGCGAGAIAITLALRAPAATVLAVDVNERARALCSANVRSLGIANVVVVHPDEVREGIAVDLILSNPPIRVGKLVLHTMLETWLDRLRPDGAAVLVVHRHLGADSLARRLESRGFDVRRRAAHAGYRVLECRPAPGGKRRSDH